MEREAREEDFNDYKKFFDETPVALIRTSIKTGEFLMANKFAVEMFGHDSFESLRANCKITDFYPAADRKRLISKIKKDGMVEGHEIEFTMPNKKLWVSARLRINCGGTCIEGSLIDITKYVNASNECLIKMKDVGSKLDKRLTALAG
jgi:PAS domain-containing protein